MASSDNRIRIAVQKSGQLAEKSLQLFEKAGIKIIKGANKLLYRAENMELDFLRVRDDDIPEFVASGACTLGIVGQNVLEETFATKPEDHVDVLKPLNFGQCSLEIAVPNTWNYSSLNEFNGKRIATSYPNLLGAFLEKNGLQAEIVEMSGAVEIAPRLKVADCICDLVSTGQTLEANGLMSVASVMESEAALIRSRSPIEASQSALLNKILTRIDSVLATQGTKYIMLNASEDALADIVDVLPGAGAPTITPLAGEPGKIAVHAVCQESVFWETLEALKACGASAILVLPIEKMMP